MSTDTVVCEVELPGDRLTAVRLARRGRNRKGYEWFTKGFVSIGRPAGVTLADEVAEGKTHIADGVASSGVSGNRRTT
jgi:hypothetical protein